MIGWAGTLLILTALAFNAFKHCILLTPFPYLLHDFPYNFVMFIVFKFLLKKPFDYMILRNGDELIQISDIIMTV